MVALNPHGRRDGITITVGTHQLVPVRVERTDDGTLAATRDLDAPTAIMVLIPVEGSIGQSTAARGDEDLDALVEEIVVEIGGGDADPDPEPDPDPAGRTGRWAVAIVAACTAAGAIGLSAMAAGLAGAIGAVFGAALACGLLAPLIAVEGRRLGLVAQPQGTER